MMLNIDGVNHAMSGFVLWFGLSRLNVSPLLESLRHDLGMLEQVFPIHTEKLSFES